MSEVKPVAWCLMTDDGQIINGVHEEARLAEQYRHRRAVDTLTSLYTADQLAEAVAAERERCLRIVMREGITPAIPDDPDPVAEAINGALQNVHEAIRSAAK